MTTAALVCLVLQASSPIFQTDIERISPVRQTESVGASRDKAPSAAEFELGIPVVKQEQTPPASIGQESAQDAIVVTANRDNAPDDPLRSVNIKSYELTRSLDDAVFRPVALAYRHGLPTPIRSGLRNVLSNFNEPVVFANYLAQHNPGKAAETFARFAINSVLGVAGVFDVAKTHKFNLPHRPNGFADTLGFYGMKPGPFLYLPLIGPSSARDLFGDVVDRLTLPLSVGKPFNKLAYALPTTALRAIDRRVEFDDRLQTLRQNPAHAYVASRELYLQSRQAEIGALHGRGTRKLGRMNGQ